MAVRVLIVDDSAFFRRRLSEILNEDSHIEVVGVAANGREAIAQVKRLKPDVITMDIEMPVMDGITAVKQIMVDRPTPVLMFSALTTDGAKATFEALDAGAMDFLPKQMGDAGSERELIKRQFCARVRLISARGLKSREPVPTTTPGEKPSYNAPLPAAPVESSRPRRRGKYRLVAIGTSTGGPVALQEVLTKLPASFPSPLLLIQHMPASFTPAFAERLNRLCAINVREAKDGDELKIGTALLAPGGKQMLVEQQRGAPVVRVVESDPEQTYKPSVDLTFSSLAEVFGSDILAMVLTGMGADGREGARQLNSKGATIWAQDEATSVIYGMPAAVAEAGLADRILPLDTIGGELAQAV